MPVSGNALQTTFTRLEAAAEAAVPNWAHELQAHIDTRDDATRQTSALINQLRLMYQRSLRAREQAQAATDDPCPMLYEGEEDHLQDLRALLTPRSTTRTVSADTEPPLAGTSGAWDKADAFATGAAAAAAAAPPQPCSYLGQGLRFSGNQRLTQIGVRRREEDWRVDVRIQGLDWSRGYVCGTMEALNVPGAKSPIVTFWEGHVVDNVNHTFYTRGWGAARETDMRHWGKFDSFQAIRPLVVQQQGRCDALEQHPYIYMRWKERFFVNVGCDCGLTIAGFYYVQLSRKDGSIKGYYYDPSSSPFQELDLAPAHSERGMAFSSFCLR